MTNFLKLVACRFLPAWAVAFALASIFHSSSVLLRLTQINVNLELSDWFFMLWQDALGLLPTYGVIIAVTLSLAFFITHFILKRLCSSNATHSPTSVRFLLFSAAGGLSFLLMLIAMQPILNVTLIAGARSFSGTAAQCMAGVCAGFIYTYLSNKKPSN
ncbi:hypothetical protein [Alteromonas gracilis]|uniref:hypothetical protein n=1 Tax=Alteromonas gracilis TaxID=1479524 RepID=UPI003736B63A